MNALLAEWRRAGRIRPATVASVVVPVWTRTLDEIRAPFAAGDGQNRRPPRERRRLSGPDNPTGTTIPRCSRDVTWGAPPAWGGLLLLRSFALEGEDRAPGLVVDFLRVLEERAAEAPDRYRRDYIEALIICRKVAAS